MEPSVNIASNLIDGRATAKVIREEIKEAIAAMRDAVPSLPTPQLAVILVGDRADSSTYVAMKEKACKECGIQSLIIRLPVTVTQTELEKYVRDISEDKSVNGLLVQLPLPSHINEKAVLDCIHYSKDVDSLHPRNMGYLALRGYDPLFKPCTAEACVELCRRNGVNLNGKNVVIVGRSNIVGMPAALLFQQENATVTVCHSRTLQIDEHCRRADILVVAIGKPGFVKPDWIKDGVIVIDVGINGIPDVSKKSGYRLVGDVDFDGCSKKCKLITPVPGGVGPMTVAMLIKNAFLSWKRASVDENNAEN